MLKEKYDVLIESEKLDDILAPRQNRTPIKEKDTNRIIYVAIGLLLVFLIFFSTVHVKGSSMEPTFNYKGDTVLVMRFAKPDYGDVVIVDNHDDWVYEKTGQAGHSEYMIKRVIAKAGDALRYTHNGEKATLWIKYKGEENYKILNEPYITDFTANWIAQYEKGNYDDWYLFDKEIVIPEGHVFVMGDNRARSFDSRAYGAVSLDKIAGVAVLAVGSGGIRYV